MDCEAESAGALTVQENLVSGWTARVDGTRVALGRGPWLNVQAPAGRHHYVFRYRPWDVPVGLGLTLGGMAMAAWMGRKRGAAVRS